MITPDEEDDPFLRQMMAGAEAREARQRALAIGCLIPAVLIPILILLALINPH